MWHDPIPHARKLAGGHQTYLWDFISLHWVNHNEQFLQPDCELSEEFKSDCLVWMLFNGKNLTAGADNLLWDNREWSITNHFIPYSEEEVNAPERFESDAGWYQIRRALKGGIKAENFRQ